ncbi:MAG: hypothetical protein PVJ67_01245 [Candidatus Pacearchaeota archaeon]|jgi:hypothetical protein
MNRLIRFYNEKIRLPILEERIYGIESRIESEELNGPKRNFAYIDSLSDLLNGLKQRKNKLKQGLEIN